MTRGLVVSKQQPRNVIINVNAFSISIRVLFVVIVSAMVVAELTSVPMWPPPIYYPWQILKLTGFVVIGILTPLAFWRFNALNRGLLYAAFSAALVETLQAVVDRGHFTGHAFHWYELAVKLVLILFGFAIGLDIRYERQIKIGPVQIVLHGLRQEPSAKRIH
jgi:uncharacterized membrane protein YbjE (DUF340 family)